MPITEKKYSQDDAICSYVYFSKEQSKLPSCLSESFINNLKGKSSLESAGENSCGDKAAVLLKHLDGLKNKNRLIMSGWFSSCQPQTEYRSQGFTTGASYHAFAYFEHENLFFACDLNEIGGSPYLQVFCSDKQMDLFRLLNAVYACKKLYLLETIHSWWNDQQASLIIGFPKLFELSELDFPKGELEEKRASSLDSSASSKNLDCIGAFTISGDAKEEPVTLPSQPAQFSFVFKEAHDNSQLSSEKERFIKELEKYLQDPYVNCMTIRVLFKQLKDRETTNPYQFIHQRKNKNWDKFRLLFKRNVNGAEEKDFWHTATYQKAIKLLKKAYLEKRPHKAERTVEEDELLDYVRGNSLLHFCTTTSRDSLTKK